MYFCHVYVWAVFGYQNEHHQNTLWSIACFWILGIKTKHMKTRCGLIIFVWNMHRAYDTVMLSYPCCAPKTGARQHKPKCPKLFVSPWGSQAATQSWDFSFRLVFGHRWVEGLARVRALDGARSFLWVVAWSPKFRNCACHQNGSFLKKLLTSFRPKTGFRIKTVFQLMALVPEPNRSWNKWAGTCLLQQSSNNGNCNHFVKAQR